MLKIGVALLNLEKIANSGQCFRWEKTGENSYTIPAFGKVLHIKQEGELLEMDCSQQEFEGVWRDYFDLDSDYGKIEEQLRTEKTPEYLVKAAKAARGIRILRQDLWEVILSFIISQNNNIPRIKGCIEKICERFGGFPDARQIAVHGPKGLEGLGLGYRTNYIIDAALSFYGDGDGSTERILRSITYEEAMRYLTSWRGIGPKVANCICLYGLGHKEAFPRDVWIKRIEAEHFDGKFPEERYPEYAGVLQQYIYFFERSEKNVKQRPC